MGECFWVGWCFWEVRISWFRSGVLRDWKNGALGRDGLVGNEIFGGGGWGFLREGKYRHGR